MNKTELAVAVAEKLDGTESDARRYVDAVFDTIMQQVAAGDRVQVTGFGTFDRLERAARTGRNPRTGEAIQVAAGTTPRFHAGQTFRAQVSATTEAVVEVEAATVPAKAEKKKAEKAAKTVKAEKPAKPTSAKKAAKPAAAKPAVAKPSSAKPVTAAAKTGPAKTASAKKAKPAPAKPKKAGKK